MAFRSFYFYKYILVLILIVPLGLNGLLSQDIRTFEWNDLSTENPYEFYKAVTDANNITESLKSDFNDFNYVLDSTFIFVEPVDFLGDDFVKQSGVFRYQFIDVDCIIRESYWAYCLGSPSCSIEPSSVFSAKFNSKSQRLGLQLDNWDGIELVHNFEMPFEDEYFYENCALVSLRRSRTRDTLLYDDNGLLSQKLELNDFEEEGTFEVVEKYYYNHDEAGHLESIIHLDFDNRFNAIVVVDSTHFVHDSLGRMIEEEWFVSDFDTIPFGSIQRYVFNYNYEGNTLISRDKRFNPTITNQDTLWRTEERTEYDYNPDGSMKYYTIWDIRGGERRPVFLKSFEYNSDIGNDEVLFPVNKVGNYAIASEEGRIDNFGYPFMVTSGDIRPGRRSYFYRPRNTVSTSDLQKLEVSLSPNPVSDILTIHMGNSSEEYQLSIYDSAGRPHLSRLSRDSRIDVSQLPIGTYHYSILSGQKIGSGTFVKM